jgi:hypothetical protein
MTLRPHMPGRKKEPDRVRSTSCYRDGQFDVAFPLQLLILPLFRGCFLAVIALFLRCFRRRETERIERITKDLSKIGRRLFSGRNSKPHRR